MLNTVCLMGRLGADPELKHTQSGVAVTSFRIAVDRTYQPKGKEPGAKTDRAADGSLRCSSDRRTLADWIDIVAWRNTADFVCKYFRKGSMIAVQGSIQTRQYTDRDGNKRTAVEVVADNVFFAAAGGRAENAGRLSKRGEGISAQAAQPSRRAPDASADTDDFEEIVPDRELPF